MAHWVPMKHAIGSSRHEESLLSSPASRQLVSYHDAAMLDARLPPCISFFDPLQCRTFQTKIVLNCTEYKDEASKARFYQLERDHRYYPRFVLAQLGQAQLFVSTHLLVSGTRYPALRIWSDALSALCRTTIREERPSGLRVYGLLRHIRPVAIATYI
ncbi:hypothetical protein PENSPDRAFT_286856 [Peniophora sp. CONT]|nr:hypothetical protein PENSPDRAFT_286856 [Peniophora sp. CONT]